MAYTSDENTSSSSSMEETSKKIRSAHMQAPEEYPQVSQTENKVPKEAEEAAGDSAPAPKEKSEGELNQNPHELLDDEQQQEEKKKEEEKSDDQVKREMSADPTVTKLMAGPKKSMTMRDVSAKIRAAQGAPDDELPISPAETKEEQQEILPIADQFAKPEGAPSKKPPKEWWDKKVMEVRKSNPDYSQDQVSKTVGDIWYNEMGTGQKSERRSAEGKSYG